MTIDPCHRDIDATTTAHDRWSWGGSASPLQLAEDHARSIGANLQRAGELSLAWAMVPVSATMLLGTAVAVPFAAPLAIGAAIQTALFGLSAPRAIGGELSDAAAHARYAVMAVMGRPLCTRRDRLSP